MIPLTGANLKKAQRSPFAKAFRALLYDSTLSYGARCFGLARLDIPLNVKVTQASLGRKLAVQGSQAHVWSRELYESGYQLSLSPGKPKGIFWA